MANLEINGRTFRDIDGYNAAKRDIANIERMKDRIDMTNIDDVRRMRDNIESGRYRFETIIGDDFLDELDELVKELSKQPVDNTKQKKAKNTGKAVKKQTIKPKQDIEEDEEFKAQVLSELRKNERKRKAWVWILGLVATFSVGYLVFYFTLFAKNDSEYKELASMIDKDAGKKEVAVNLEQEKDKPPVLKKYEELYKKNRKLVGWLTIEGTNIDYPVMQTINNEYYLDHNYMQDYDKNGSIFMDKDCTPAFPNDNMIIYGHHMKSGKMFGNLNYYAKEEYYKEHPQIKFDTIYEEGIYDVMYVFRSRIYSEEEITFKYYKFIDATSEDEFYSNMEEMEKMSLYDTGITAVYGDKLITLSTCDSSEANGRFVVVARKKR